MTQVFESELDYRSFALRIDEDDLDSLSETIRDLTPRAIRRLQAGVARCGLHCASLCLIDSVCVSACARSLIMLLIVSMSLVLGCCRALGLPHFPQSYIASLLVAGVCFAFVVVHNSYYYPARSHCVSGSVLRSCPLARTRRHFYWSEDGLAYETLLCSLGKRAARSGTT